MRVFDYDPDKKTMTEVTDAANTAGTRSEADTDTESASAQDAVSDKKSGEARPVNREGHLRGLINYSDRF